MLQIEDPVILPAPLHLLDYDKTEGNGYINFHTWHDCNPEVSIRMEISPDFGEDIADDGNGKWINLDSNIVGNW